MKPAFTAAILCLLAMQACTDTDGRYGDFLDRTATLRSSAGDDAGADAGERLDFSGEYLLALSTVLAPDAPMLFAAEVEVNADLSALNLRLQPLATAQQPNPRAPVGDPIDVLGVPYLPDGRFIAALGTLTVPGAANPISGSDIIADVEIHGTSLPADGQPQVFCGRALGMVEVPLQFDLAGSTFGAVATGDVATTAPLLACP